MTTNTYTVGQRITVKIPMWYADANHRHGGRMSTDLVSGIIHKVNRCSVRLDLQAPRGQQRTPENGLYWNDRIATHDQIVS